MVNYKELFKGKKITVMGLGLLGRGLGYTKFLAECGADLIVTDLKTKEQLATSLKALEKYTHSTTLRAKQIKFVLGEHKLEDFRNRDIVMKMAGVPKDSIYLEEARKSGASIEMDVSLFIKSFPEITVIGVTGTRGKSMTTQLIYEILKDNVKFIYPSTKLGTKIPSVFLGGNIRGVATLPFLKKVKAGDILVCELDSWQLQGFGEAKFSPHISVFTSFMPDHMNYYQNSMDDYFKDKSLIFTHQKENDFLITDTKVKSLIKTIPKSQIILASKKSVADFHFIVPGEHQRQNLAYAVAVAEILGIPKNAIRKTVKKFKGVEGRLEYLRTYKGIKIYNDNNATTPEATIAGIKAVKGEGKDVVLLCGGADKKVDLKEFTKEVNKNCKFVSLIPGTGTDNLIKNYGLKAKYEIAKDFKAKSTKSRSLDTSGVFRDAVMNAIKNSKKGDVLLFSPAFASFGLFNNEYERNDLFVKIIKGLK